jgi:hypothetical protein
VPTSGVDGLTVVLPTPVIAPRPLSLTNTSWTEPTAVHRPICHNSIGSDARCRRDGEQREKQ